MWHTAPVALLLSTPPPASQTLAGSFQIIFAFKGPCLIVQTPVSLSRLPSLHSILHTTNKILVLEKRADHIIPLLKYLQIVCC